MRCPQCGFEAQPQATFCSRCGTRFYAPRPSAVREYALVRVLPSWWHFTRSILLALILLAAGVYVLGRAPDWRLGAALIALGVLRFLFIVMERRNMSWSLTSERLIERRGVLSRHRRELELADVRSVEVDSRLMQRLVGLGDVLVASAAHTDAVIRMRDVPDPEEVAEMLRQARAKRLA